MTIISPDDPRHVIIRIASNSYRDATQRCHAIRLKSLTKAACLVKPFSLAEDKRYSIDITLNQMSEEGYLWIDHSRPSFAKFDMHHDFIASHIFVDHKGHPWKWVSYIDDSCNLRGWLARHPISA